MKKALIFWFSFLLLLLAMTSCKSKKVFVEKLTIKDSISETIKDTTFEVAKDSSSYSAQLGTDENGKIVIKEITSTSSGRKLKTPSVKIVNNQLEVDCESEAEKKFVTWKETFIKSYRELNKPIITNELTWWQKTQIYVGRTLFGILFFWLLLILFKFKKL